ncbi:uncharacterized protein [Misgurnus anguillicaudatus]|uniref:uncharacterized protein n=1 Tax=Misgurnus anguillicaudatus TaxID=75329 RepID=UPI0024360AE4|nr:protein POLR1D-like [Misgurnus anguillicaudatus]
MDDNELERKAVEELLKEAKRAKVRAETMGPSGWMKCPLGSTNKRFLLNTLGSSAMIGEPKTQGGSERGEKEHRYRTCEKHRKKDCEECRKDHSHSRKHSHSHSSKHQSTSRSHSPSRRSNRTRSRSPARGTYTAVKNDSDRRKK